MDININVNSNADKCFSTERNTLPDIKENTIRDINQNNKYLKIFYSHSIVAGGFPVQS